MRCATRSIRARCWRGKRSDFSFLEKQTPRCAFGSRPPYQGVKAMSLLEVRDLSIYFGPRKVVDSVSLSLDAGEKLALVGESASGKTVTALSTLRLIENARLTGEILFNGEQVLKMSPEELRDLRGRDIAVIFQEPMTALNPIYAVGD